MILRNPWFRAGFKAWSLGLEASSVVGSKDAEVDLITADDPPTPISKRKALVRSDRVPGDPRRVLGVAYGPSMRPGPLHSQRTLAA